MRSSDRSVRAAWARYGWAPEMRLGRNIGLKLLAAELPAPVGHEVRQVPSTCRSDSRASSRSAITE
jgi:hypothetical protein